MTAPARRFWKRLRPRRAIGWVGVALVLLLVLVRLLLPGFVQRAINHRLDAVPEYGGRVGEVSLHFWRGAYSIEGVAITKQRAAVQQPFFSAARIDFSIAWRELFRGRLVSDIEVEQGRLVLARAPSKETSQLETDRRWQDVIQDIFPIEITRLEIHGGELRFIDTTQSPHVDVAVKDMQLLATGLRNREADSPEELPARVDLTGSTVGDGLLDLRVWLAPLARKPRFDLDLKLTRVSLPAMNDFLRAYANVDVSRGNFELFMEVAARDGAFEGYVKPFFSDLDFENLTDKQRRLPGRIWETLVDFMEEIVKNKDRNQLGTRVPFSGQFGETEVGTWTAVVNTMRNGFVRAFSESLEGTIQPEDVKTDGG